MTKKPLEDKWINYLIEGGNVPDLDLPTVTMPDKVTLYKCTNCGKWNDYWQELCSECDEREAREVDDAIQDE